MITLLKNFLVSKYGLGLGVVLLCILAVSISVWKTNVIDAKMERAQDKIEQAETKLKTAYEIIDKMHTEHDAALEAANIALKERLDIYEAARDRICEMEKRINGNSKFCDQLVPDDIVQLWKEQDAERISNNSVPATE